MGRRLRAERPTASAGHGTGSVARSGADVRERLWLRVVLVLTLLVFLRSAWNGFTFDDARYVAAYTRDGVNTLVTEDHALRDYFTEPMGLGVQSTSRSFRPLTVLSYAWTHRLARAPVEPPRLHPDFPEVEMVQRWTDSPWPHHLLNVLLHVLATYVAFRLARRLLGPGPGAVLTAAVFGWHALHSDPVASIVGRGELLPFVFGGLGTLLHLQASAPAGGAGETPARSARPAWLRIGPVALCMLMAFLSKESAIGWLVMAPACALALHLGQGHGWRWSLRQQAWSWSLGVLVPALLWFLLRANMLATSAMARAFVVPSADNFLYPLSLVERLPTAVHAWGLGLQRLLCPYPLACDYGPRVLQKLGYGDAGFLIAAAALVVLGASAALALRRAPVLFAALVAVLGFGFLTSNIPVPIETVFGERHYYTPVFGVALAAGLLLQRQATARGGFASWRAKVLLGCAAAWLLLSAGLCVQRCIDWTSNATLFAADAEGQPQSIRMQMAMANVCRDREDWDARRQYLERVLELDPESYLANSDVAGDLMAEYRFADAEPYMARAVQTIEGRQADLQLHGAEIHLNHGMVLLALGRNDAARASCERSLSLSGPRSAGSTKRTARSALLGLLWLAWRRGDQTDAGRLLAEVERVLPEEPAIVVYRAVLDAGKADPAATIAALEPIARREEALHTLVAIDQVLAAQRRLGRNDTGPEWQLRRGEVAARLGQLDQARQSFRRVVEDGRLALQGHYGLLRLAWDTEGPTAVDALLRRAHAVAPNDGVLGVYAGMLAQGTGNSASAVRILSQIVPRMPEMPETARALSLLAEAFAAVGETGKARQIVANLIDQRGLPREVRRRVLGLHQRLE